MAVQFPYHSPAGVCRPAREAELPGHERIVAQSESLQGLAAIQRHFTAGEIGPITVLLSAGSIGTAVKGDWKSIISTRGFASLPNVAEVRSLTQPLGNPIPNPRPIEEPENYAQKAYNFVSAVRACSDRAGSIEARGHFVAELPEKDQQARPVSVTRLDVILQTRSLRSQKRRDAETDQDLAQSGRPNLVLDS